MSRIADEIREYVKDPELTGSFEYGAWGILRKDQRAKIRELCDACDMFEQTADNFYKELMFYKRALELACERLQREDVYRTQAQVKFYLDQAKKEMENKLKEWKKSRYNAS